MKKRIWELDALRGLCVLGMVVVHLIYDLTDLYRVVQWDLPELFHFVKSWGGVLFLLISGISVTLGKHHVKRGALVCAAGLLVSAVTAGMYLFGFVGKSIIIYFGVLHCLGVCMLLWGLLRRLPNWALLLCGLVLVALCLWLKTVPRVDYPWLIPFGVVSKTFASSDYFPLLPNLGFFLVGAFLGRTVYRKRESLLPQAGERLLPVRFLSFCGRQSLWIYLLHQPVLTGFCMILMWIL